MIDTAMSEDRYRPSCAFTAIDNNRCRRIFGANFGHSIREAGEKIACDTGSIPDAAGLVTGKTHEHPVAIHERH